MSQNSEELLKKFYENGKLGHCIKDNQYKVLYQNSVCKKLCGDQIDVICDKNCMLLYLQHPEAPDREKGSQLFSHELIEGQYFDVILINDGDYLTTILYPLEERYEADQHYFSQFSLTNRELEIVSLVNRNLNNNQIAETLFISIGTLRTHINNINKKLPEGVQLRQ